MDINLCMGCMKPKDTGKYCSYCGFCEDTYKAEPHQLPLYTILHGKYLIGKVLGEGGFGITYLGWDLALQIKVAVKEYYPGSMVSRRCDVNSAVSPLSAYWSTYEAGMNRFLDEARRLGKFWNLQGIVSVKDYFQENQTAYIVMEYIEGETLKEVLRRQEKLPASDVFSMMRPVMDALEIIHNAGIIHRDISPDNMMINREGQVKLIDFGAARDFSGQDGKSMSVILKPGYSPVEQYSSNGKQGPWTDIYALCATMYRAITGEIPAESLDRMNGVSLASPSLLSGETLPEYQEQALLRGLEVQPQNRFQNIEALKAACYAVEQSETVPLKDRKEKDFSLRPDTARKPSLGKKRIKYGWLAAGAAVLLLFIVGAVIFVKSRNTQERETYMAGDDSGERVSLKKREQGGSVETAKSTENPAMENSRNLSNGGYIAEDGQRFAICVLGEGVFYLDVGNDLNADLYEGTASALNLVGNTVYFLDGDGCICSVDTNGTKSEEVWYVSGQKGRNLLVGETNFYYIVENSDRSGFSILRFSRSDPSTYELVASDCSNAYAVALKDGWIYYNSMGMEAVCKVSTDGSETETLYSISCDRLVILDDTIYGCTEDTLWSCETDGSNAGRLFTTSDYRITGLNVASDETIYITVSGENSGIGVTSAVSDSINWFYVADAGITMTDVNLFLGADNVASVQNQGERQVMVWFDDDGEVAGTFGDSLGRREGITSGNLLNDGLVAENGSDMYYISSGRLVCGDPVEGSGTEFDGYAAGCINVVNDYLYYIGGEYSSLRDYSIMRAGLDGSNVTALLDCSPDYLYVTDQQIYYENYKGVFRAELDGSNAECIAEDIGSKDGFCIVNGYIYYNSDAGICRMNTDGTEKTVISETSGDFISDGEYIYCRQGLRKVLRMSLDGTQEDILIETDDNKIWEINCADGWLYYRMTVGDNEEIRRVSADGSQSENLGTACADDDTFYNMYVSADDGSVYYKYSKKIGGSTVVYYGRKTP